MTRILSLLALALLSLTPLAAAEGADVGLAGHCVSAATDGAVALGAQCSPGVSYPPFFMKAKERGNQVKCSSNLSDAGSCDAGTNDTAAVDVDRDGKPDLVVGVTGTPSLAIGDPGCNCRFVDANLGASFAMDAKGIGSPQGSTNDSVVANSTGGSPESLDVSAGAAAAGHSAIAFVSGGKKGLNAVNVKLA